MLVCRTIGLSPLLNLIKRMFALRTIEREGGGCPREMAELQDPNSTVMGSMPVKTFYSGLLLEKSFSNAASSPLSARNSKFG